MANVVLTIKKGREEGERQRREDGNRYRGFDTRLTAKSFLA